MDNCIGNCCRIVDGVTCGEPGKYIPVILLRENKGDKPVEMVLDLPLCAAHVDTDIHKYVSDDSWEQLVEMVMFSGGNKPIRELTAVRFVTYDEYLKIMDGCGDSQIKRSLSDA